MVEAPIVKQGHARSLEGGAVDIAVGRRVAKVVQVQVRVRPSRPRVLPHRRQIEVGFQEGPLLGRVVCDPGR
jgi:hypothetical protein